MTLERLRELALSLPGASEQPHFERMSFRVGTRIFATAVADGSEAMVPVKPPERVQMLLDSYPEVFFSYGGWTAKLGSLGVRLDRVDPALMRVLVLEAWERIAPAKLRAQGPGN
jgi:hypothetical protein